MRSYNVNKLGDFLIVAIIDVLIEKDEQMQGSEIENIQTAIDIMNKG